MRIFIADPKEAVVSALSLLIEQQPGMIIAGVGNNRNELLAEIEGLRPDLVLLDWDFVGPQAQSLFYDLRALDFKPRLVVMSSEQQARKAALAAGAHAFVSKADSPKKLLTTLHLFELENE